MEREESRSGNVDKAVVIYHAHCVDGFASAWAFHTLKEKDYPGGVEYLAKSYGQEGPYVHELMNKDVYVLDFSYSREIIKNFACFAANVLILDHHKTAQEALVGWPDQPANVKIVFDMDRSGCGITWDYFCGEIRGGEACFEPRPALINYAEDRDLWRFLLPDSKLINKYVGVQKQTFEDYTNCDAELSNISFVRGVASYLEQQFNQYVESILSQCARPITINGQKGLVCNANGMFASELGNILAQQSGTYGATYYHGKDDAVKFSLRSNGNYDVSAIAKIFGGGGHKNAAGFELKDPHISDIKNEEGIVLWAAGHESLGIDKTTQED